MKLIAYIAVSSTSSIIERFHAVAGSGVLKTRGSKTGAAASSTWRTKRESLDPTDFESSIDNYLIAKRSVIEIIRKHRTELDQAYLMLVTSYDDGESPRGFSISQRAIQVLAEFDAAFEIDVVSVLDEAMS